MRGFRGPLQGGVVGNGGCHLAGGIRARVGGRVRRPCFLEGLLII